MVCIEIFSKCAKFNYKSHLCSRASIFVFITNFVAIALPFVFAYNSKGFWLKTDSFYDQPNIKFKYEYLFYAEPNDLSSPIFCSNIINLNENLKECSIIKINELDNNYDGKYDELNFNLEIIENTEQLKIKSIILLLFFDIKIENICPLQVQSPVILQSFTSTPGTQLNVIGNLKLVQNNLFPCNQNKVLNTNVVDEESFEIWKFIKDNSNKNITTQLENIHAFWIPGSGTTFSMDINIKYIHQFLYYKPNFWQVIKFAWIQYLSLFITIKWLINKVQNYVFTNKLVLYYHSGYSDKYCNCLYNKIN